jgi:predicted ABC-type sugar transport system permease subunit
MKKSIIDALQLGFIIGFSVMFFTGIGLAVDNWLNTKPIFVLIGIFFGIFNGLFYLWKWAQKA